MNTQVEAQWSCLNCGLDLRAAQVHGAGEGLLRGPLCRSCFKVIQQNTDLLPSITSVAPVLTYGDMRRVIAYLHWMARCCDSVLERGLDDEMAHALEDDLNDYLKAAALLDRLINPQ